MSVDDPKSAENADVKLDSLSKYIEKEKMAFAAMDGFLLILSDDGEITYVSENISEILGLSMVRRLHVKVWPIIKKIIYRLT